MVRRKHYYRSLQSSPRLTHVSREARRYRLEVSRGSPQPWRHCTSRGCASVATKRCRKTRISVYSRDAFLEAKQVPSVSFQGPLICSCATAGTVADGSLLVEPAPDAHMVLVGLTSAYVDIPICASFPNICKVSTAERFLAGDVPNGERAPSSHKFARR